jgi:hypothetical protein
MAYKSPERSTRSENPLMRLFRRVFYVDPVDSCNPGWYLRSETGRVFGPFISKADASRTLRELTI